MIRNLQILAGVASAQALLVAFTWWPTATSTVEARDLVGLSSDAIDRIVLTGRAEVGDDKPVGRVELRKEGATWLIASAHDYPADIAKVTEILTKLPDLTGRTPLTSQAANHAAMNVAADNHARTLEIHAGANSATLVLGAASGSAVHVRRADEDDVFAVRGWTAFSLGDQASRYWDSKLIDLEATTLDSLTVTNPAGGFTLERGPEGWGLAGDEDVLLDVSRVDAELNRLLNVRLSEVAGTSPTPDLGSTRVEWTAQVGDQTVRGALSLGATVDSLTSAQLSGERWVVKIASSSTDRWSTLTLDDLLATPPPE